MGRRACMSEIRKSHIDMMQPPIPPAEPIEAARSHLTALQAPGAVADTALPSGGHPGAGDSVGASEARSALSFALPDWLRPHVTAASFIAYITATGYFVAFAYETSYCAEFGIPSYFVRIGLENVVSAAGYLVLGLSTVFACYFWLFGRTKPLSPPLSVFVATCVMTLLPIIVPIAVHPASIRRDWAHLAVYVFIVTCIVFPGRSILRGWRSFLDALSRDLASTSSAPSIIGRTARKTGWVLIYVIIFSGFSTIAARNMGRAEAATTEEYLVTNEAAPRAIIRSYADYVILVTAEDLVRGPDKNEAATRVAVVPISSLTERTLMRRRLAQ